MPLNPAMLRNCVCASVCVCVCMSGKSHAVEMTAQGSILQGQTTVAAVLKCSRRCDNAHTTGWGKYCRDKTQHYKLCFWLMTITVPSLAPIVQSPTPSLSPNDQCKGSSGRTRDHNLGVTKLHLQPSRERKKEREWKHTQKNREKDRQKCKPQRFWG